MAPTIRGSVSQPVYVHGATEAGPRRKNNEDAFRIERFGESGVLVVVCDGMGGHADGEVASAVGSDTLVARLKPVEPGSLIQDFRGAFAGAHEAVRGISLDGSPGTTAVALRVEGNLYWYAWVGDSRMYLLSDGRARALTRDHTRAEELIAGGAMTPAEAARSPHAQALTRVLGGRAEGAAEPGTGGPVELAPGDALLLCTDGLTKMLDDEEIGPLAAGRDYRDAGGRLLQEALDRGGHDNTTVVVVVAGSPNLNGERVHGRVKTRAVPPPELGASSVSGGSTQARPRLSRPALIAALLLSATLMLGVLTGVFTLIFLSFH